MLRDYQNDIKQKIVNSPSQYNLAVLPTGAGKTVCMADIFKSYDVPAIAIAHRQELVSQISIALAREQLPHNIIAPDSIIKFCIHRHIRELNRSFYSADAKTGVAGVDTIIRRDVSRWADRIQLWQIDEAHHVLPENKWGKAADMFKHAAGIGWTATPYRSDRKPLGNVFQAMHIGPSMRDLITRGHLCDYKIFGPARVVDTSSMIIGSTGDYTRNSLVTATERADITGDIVEQYLKHARGKRGVTFAASVRLAERYAGAFRDAGVPAAFIDASTPDRDRASMIDAFRSGNILQLCNVDIFGEGFDLPAIECVSMARATASRPLYVQVFGRGLRTAPGKQFGIIIDHVGNVQRHGLPDAPQHFTLESGEPQITDENDIPIRQCPNHTCLAVFQSWSKECPECGCTPPKVPATDPQHVEGDLIEYDAALLDKMRHEAARAIADAPPGAPAYIKTSMQKRAETQHELRDTIALWAGYWRDIHNATDSEIHKRFYRKFGVDILTAQAMRTADAQALLGSIRAVLI